MLILIVEDQALLGITLAWELRDAGHTILGPVSAVSHAQCLAAQERPHLALIDMELQRSTQAIELARSLQAQHGIPSLILTSDPAAIRPHTNAVLGIIAKPFNLADIHRSVSVAETVMLGGTPLPPTIPRVLELLERVH